MRAHITQVKRVFKEIHNLKPGLKHDGSQFDHLFKEGEAIALGNLSGEMMLVPGHTPACAAYRFRDVAFVGDTLFMPDVGTARCDFPGGDARAPDASTHKLLSLPPQTHLFMCHDYPPAGRTVAFDATVRPAAREQHTCARWGQRRCVRGYAHQAGRHAGHAHIDPALSTDQHPRQRTAANGR